MSKKNIYKAAAFALALGYACGDSKKEDNKQPTLDLEYSGPPYTVQVEEYVNPALPGLHSYTHGTYDDKIVMFGGRRNGLHASGYLFNQARANKNIYVIDTKKWSSPDKWEVHEVGDSVIIKTDPASNKTSKFFNGGQFRANNAEFFTEGDVLYVAGGLLGFDKASNPDGPNSVGCLTAIDMPALIEAVIKKKPVPSGAIRQTADPRFALTGGEVRIMDKKVYLVFGWDYTNSNNGFYSHQVSTFTYKDDKKQLSATFNPLCATCSDGITDTSSNAGNFRRRDGSISEMIDPATGKPALVYYAGVFKNGNTNFTTPVWIGENSAAELPFTMRSNVYTCQVMALYSKKRKHSYATMLGGMTNGQFTGTPIKVPTEMTDANSYIIPPDTTNYLSVPFSNHFTTLTIDETYTFKQYLLPDSFPKTKVPIKLLPPEDGNSEIAVVEIPAGTAAFNGAESEILWTLDKKYLTENGVIDYDKFMKDYPNNGVIGYLHGGILSAKTNMNMNNTTHNQAKFSIASKRIFAIKIVPVGKQD